MTTGTVKWFNNTKGFGFIEPENGGDDIFAHYSQIQGEGYKTLMRGQTVQFTLSDGTKGPFAAEIQAEALEAEQEEAIAA